MTRRALALLVLASCTTSIDERTEEARRRVLALDAKAYARIVAFCRSWKQPGALLVSDVPEIFPVPPVSAHGDGVRVTFEWWNNSHAEEDTKHPAFSLICSDGTVAGGRPLADGLWYVSAR